MKTPEIKNPVTLRRSPTARLSPLRRRRPSFPSGCRLLRRYLSTSSYSNAKEMLYKNRLQEFTQRANLPLPIYHTFNEQEVRQSSKFRSYVEVDGKKYTSLSTFPTKKAAEQDVAKLALEDISENIKNCASNRTFDEHFPPIHEDRVFSKSILHEFAAKKNLPVPAYDTVKLDGVVPLFVSSLVFDGLKYTGEPTHNKKDAEQLAARTVILSLLANSGVETNLSEIVKSKAKLFSAVHEHSKVYTSVSHLPNSGSDVATCAVKEIISDNGKQTSDMSGTEEFQQQSASKKARFPDKGTKFREPNLETCRQLCFLPGNQTVPQPSVLPSSQALLRLGLLPYYEQALSQPSTLPNAQTFPQPSSLPNSSSPSQPSLLPSTQTLPQLISRPNSISPSEPSLLPSTQTFPQPSLLSNSSSPSQPSLIPSTQTFPQPSLLHNSSSSSPSQWSMPPRTQAFPQPSSLPNSSAPSQPNLLQSTQTFPQPSLLPNSNTLPQPSLLPSTQSLPQQSLLPSSNTLTQPSVLPNTETLHLPSLSPNSQSLPQPDCPNTETLHLPSLSPNSQSLPQPDCLPFNFSPSRNAETPSNESASSKRRKKKKANKKAKDGRHMQISTSPPR